MSELCVWVPAISWRPQRGLVHLWAEAASFRVRWRHLEGCRGTPQEHLLQIGSGPPPPLLKPLLSFLTTNVGWLLSLNLLCHCSTAKWACCQLLRGKKKGQNKLYLVTLFLGSTTVKGFFAGPSRRGLPFILFFLFLHKIVHNRVMLWLQCS